MKENNFDIEKAINNAAASVEMEGFYVDEECKEWCREYLRDEITMDEYMKRLLEKVWIEYNPDK